MTTTTLMPLPKLHFETVIGTPLIGGKVYTYAAGTTNLKPTYTAADGSAQHENPITLNARGEPPSPIFWNGNYRVDLRDALGNLVYTVDNYNTDPAGIWNVFQQVLDRMNDDDGASLIGFLQSGAGAVQRSMRDKARDVVDVRDFGAKGDGATDDSAAIQAAINHGGRVRLIDNATHKILNPLSLDISKASLVGCGSVIDASASVGGAALTVFSSADYGANRLNLNWTHWIEGVAFEGSRVTGNVLITVGNAAYLNSSEITFRNCGFRNAGTLVKFIDNAWRVNFDHCGFETPEDYYLYFNSPANAGEVMRFAHCWFVDGPAYIYLKEGQWIFDSCSFPGGGVGGIQCVGAPHVVIRNCNLETQPAAASQYIVEGYGSSFILIDGCIISTNGGAANQALLAASDACGMRITNCTLPLFGGDLRSETNSLVRQLVAGNSQYVSAQNNYVKGTGANDRLQWAVIGKQVNKLRNGDAETGDTSGWTVSTYGTALTGTFTNVNTAPKTGTRCFMISCPADGGVEANQTFAGASAYAGRAVVFGMWAKAVGGVGNVDFPIVRFLDATGAVIGTTAIGTSSADVNWTWIGGYGVIPTGTEKIQFAIGGQQQVAGAHQVYYDDIVLNII